jgi:hypothetical protein
MCGSPTSGTLTPTYSQSFGAELGHGSVLSPSLGGVPTEVPGNAQARADVVIDSGFNVGPANQANAGLLAEAAQMGKTIFSLRPPEAIKISRGSLSS